MIAIASKEGALVRTLPKEGCQAETFGFHRLFGFISERAANERLKNRNRHGLKTKGQKWLCKFSLSADSQGLRLTPLQNCQVKKQKNGGWNIRTPVGSYRVSKNPSIDPARLAPRLAEPRRDWRLTLLIPVIPAAVLMIIALLTIQDVSPTGDSSVAVRFITQHPQGVNVPYSVFSRRSPKIGPSSRRGQGLGFLAVGEKVLQAAVGGDFASIVKRNAGRSSATMPSAGLVRAFGKNANLKSAKRGDIQGVEIGTKGVGGGQDNYGHSVLEGGTARAVSVLAPTREILLTGGLDPSVVQATIAKYLHQVRACYETRGLRTNASLRGRVTMRFEVSPVGSLNFVHVASTTLANQAVEQCIAGRMMAWQFPRPVGGARVKVSYPFLLRPVRSM